MVSTAFADTHCATVSRHSVTTEFVLPSECHLVLRYHHPLRFVFKATGNCLDFSAAKDFRTLLTSPQLLVAARVFGLRDAACPGCPVHLILRAFPCCFLALGVFISCSCVLVRDRSAGTSSSRPRFSLDPQAQTRSSESTKCRPICSLLGSCHFERSPGIKCSLTAHVWLHFWSAAAAAPFGIAVLAFCRPWPAAQQPSSPPRARTRRRRSQLSRTRSSSHWRASRLPCSSKAWPPTASSVRIRRPALSVSALGPLWCLK